MSSSSSSGASKLGLILFAIYTLFYASFVLVNAFAAQWSEWKPLGDLNLAILWGFGLIIVAFILSVIYGLFAPKEPVGNGDDE